MPRSMQVEIKKIHSKGHFAVAKTADLLKCESYIPESQKHIENIISNCVHCIPCNKKKRKGDGLLNPIPKEDVPLSRYHVDFIGPLPSINKSYNHIFSIVDAFSKFVWLYPVKSTTTQCALEMLKIQQNMFGNPSRIITDQGAAFKSSDFEEYCKTEGINHLMIATGIPRANGQIERMHGILIPVLAKLSIDDPTKWYQHVASVQYS